MSADAAQWLSAGATTAAFIAASAAGVVATRTYRIQRDQFDNQKDQRQERERTYQARRVAVWLALGEDAWYLWVSNSSELPVYQTVLRLRAPSIDTCFLRGTLGPSAPRVSDTLTRLVRTTLEGPDRAFVVRCYEEDDGARRGVEVRHGDGVRTMSRVGVELVFTDAAGVRWHRDWDGHLTDVAAEFMTTST